MIRQHIKSIKKMFLSRYSTDRLTEIQPRIYLTHPWQWVLTFKTSVAISMRWGGGQGMIVCQVFGFLNCHQVYCSLFGPDDRVIWFTVIALKIPIGLCFQLCQRQKVHIIHNEIKKISRRQGIDKIWITKHHVVIDKC